MCSFAFKIYIWIRELQYVQLLLCHLFDIFPYFVHFSHGTVHRSSGYGDFVPVFRACCRRSYFTDLDNEDFFTLSPFFFLLFFFQSRLMMTWRWKRSGLDQLTNQVCFRHKQVSASVYPTSTLMHHAWTHVRSQPTAVPLLTIGICDYMNVWTFHCGLHNWSYLKRKRGWIFHGAHTLNMSGMSHVRSGLYLHIHDIICWLFYPLQNGS